jgi:predicted transcriptional regulator
MGRSNVTLQLDDEILRRARMLAAERSTSVSRLVAEQIEKLVDDDARYDAARRRALALLARGYHLGGGELPTRDELHVR